MIFFIKKNSMKTYKPLYDNVSKWSFLIKIFYEDI